MSSNKTQIAGIILFFVTLVALLALNLYFIELQLFGWYSPIFFGTAIGGFLFTLIFFFLANSHFKKIAEHPLNRIIGWVCMLIFLCCNFLANYAGIDELIRINYYY